MSRATPIGPPRDRRRNAIYLVIIVCLLAGLVTGQDLFFNVAYLFIGLLLFAFVWARTGTSWLRLARRTRPRRAQVGHYLEERFTLRNNGLLPKLWLEVYDESELPGHRASHVVSSLRRSSTWSVRTLCLQRGVFRLGPVRLVAGDPFGLFQTERKIDAVAQLTVFPATVNLPAFALPAGALPGGDAVRRRTHLVTTNAAGVRDYHPGDSFNRIHWQSTAPTGKLIVKDFDLDFSRNTWIVMDMNEAAQIG
ncbi:MAG: DUF58 domain-containing protein, partial [Anaerolineae bacterium]